MARILPHEIEALSAYLDNELPPAERLRLEGRLRANPSLRLELAELRRVRTALRRQPRLRAPRSFTLTPEMVQAYAKANRRRGAGLPSLARPRAYPFFRLASALATVLLVVVLLGDLTTGFSPRISAPTAENAPAAEAVAGSAVEAPEAVPEADQGIRMSEQAIEEPVLPQAYTTQSEPTSADIAAPAFKLPPIRLLEAGLAGIALLSGLAAFSLHRRGKT